jgi:hypothetical protein
MLKYLGWFALVFLLSVITNYKHDQYANKAAANSGNHDFSLFLYDAPKSKDYSPDPKDKAAVWWERSYVYFGWPSGTTIWALVVTFAVISEQTMATRKAAENAGKQLAFQKEALRPRIRITNFTNDTFNEAFKGDWVFVNMEISNSGGLPGYGVIADTWIEFVHGVPPYRFSSQAKYKRMDYALNVHVGVPEGIYIPLHRRLTEEERRDMREAKGAICFRVRMTYRAFTDEVHTDQAYMIRPQAMESIGEYSSET